MNVLDAIIRNFTRKLSGAIDFSMTEWEALRVTQHEAPGQEETRAGLRYSIAPKNGVTGIAPVQAIPTTAAQWVLFNKDNIKSLILEEVGAYLVSGTAGAGIELLATLFTTPGQAATAMNAGMQVTSNNGGGGGNAGQAATSAMICAASVTLSQPATPSWYPIAAADSSATAIGSVAVRNDRVAGRIIIPPNSGLALAVISPTGTTPLFAPFASWVEKAIQNQ